MAIGGPILGSSDPARFEIVRHKDGTAWLDVDKDRQATDGDAFLSVRAENRSEPVKFDELKRAIAAGGRDEQTVLENLEKPGAASLGVVGGSSCAAQITASGQKQTFEQSDEGLFITLTPDPAAPHRWDFESLSIFGDGTTNTVSLVEDGNGILRWESPPAPPPPPPAAGAVTEATCVERDGVLHWLFPGDVPQAGDKIMGNPDTFADNILKK